MAANRLNGMTTVRFAFLTAILTVLVTISAGALPIAAGAEGPAASLGGTVLAAGKPLAGAVVTLYAGTREGATPLGKATTDENGTFKIAYTAPDAGVLYVDARSGGTGAEASRLRLLSVAGVLGNGGAVTPHTLDSVTVNELTTVAGSFALAQFFEGADIWGASPGLENAAATSFNLADPATGNPGIVITDANNGANNDSLATLNSLANLVSLCAAPPAGAPCGEFLNLATPPGAKTPDDTVQAVVNLVRNPSLAPNELYTLAQTAAVYAPALDAAPEAWLLGLLYTDSELFASGRIAFDARGNMWSNNNWQPGTTTGSDSLNVLNPLGKPILGSPISGGGLDGAGWGNAIGPDGSVWVSNFSGSTVSKFASDGTPLSPSTGWADGGINRPQGVAVDQKGNVWIANNYGSESTPGEGSVVVYPGGDPTKAITITGGGINHPFAVQIDGRGNAWVGNWGDNGFEILTTREAILNGKTGGSVTVIGPDFKPTSYSPIEGALFQLPLGLAFDSQGNGWTASFFDNTVTEIRPDGTIAQSFKLPGPFSPWGVAIDGSDRVWVAGFSLPGVSLLCGANTAACPPGSKTGDILSPSKFGFRTKSMQHLTSAQVDQSGNLWLSNNWTTLQPPSGGVGVVELIGISTPVCTPLTPLPLKPSTATAQACPNAQAAVLPSTGKAVSSQLLLELLAGLGILGLGIFLLLPRRQRTPRGE